MNYKTKNVIGPGDAYTGAFMPYGVPSWKGEVIKGQVPCTGAIMRVPLAGGQPELVAWGLRNPTGLAFAKDGKLLVTENSYDERGNRPVFGTGDLLWEITPGVWYGWPDYWAGKKLTDQYRFRPRFGKSSGKVAGG